jgi:phage terminase small subunit
MKKQKEAVRAIKARIAPGTAEKKGKTAGEGRGTYKGRGVGKKGGKGEGVNQNGVEEKRPKTPRKQGKTSAIQAVKGSKVPQMAGIAEETYEDAKQSSQLAGGVEQEQGEELGEGGEWETGDKLTSDEVELVERSFSWWLVRVSSPAKALRAAFEEAGMKVPSPRRLANQASWLLSRPGTKVEVKRAQFAASGETLVTQDRVLQEMGRIGFANLSDVLTIRQNKDGCHTIRVADLADLSPDERAAIKKIKVTAAVMGDARIVETVEVQMHDKVAALEKLGAHFGMFGGADEKQLPAVHFHLSMSGDQIEGAVTRPRPEVPSEILVPNQLKFRNEARAIAGGSHDSGSQAGVIPAQVVQQALNHKQAARIAPGVPPGVIVHRPNG